MKEEILEAIWGHSYVIGTYPYLATIHRLTGQFSERSWKFYEDLSTHLEQPAMYDMFFSPLSFTGPRTNDNVSLPGVLFADMDDTPTWPAGIPQASVVWETSPDNMQAVWFLAEAPLDVVRWARVNRALTYAAHADKGGWHASKLLRVPETRNYKRDKMVQGKVLSFTQEVFDFTKLEDQVAHLARFPVVSLSREGTLERPALPNHDEWLALCRYHWPTIALENRASLAAPRMMDRSSQLVRVSNRLRWDGLSPTAVFQLLWGVAWNKWRTDRHNPEYLWHLVCS